MLEVSAIGAGVCQRMHTGIYLHIDPHTLARSALTKDRLADDANL